MELQLRGLAPRSPRSAYVRPFAQSAFVDKDDMAAFAEGFFLRAGHVYRCQRRIASSSLSRAFPAGLWQLHPRSRNNRHTWPGWYITPHSRPMTAATRGSVHKPVAYPCASGPSCNTRVTCLRCGSLNRGRRPVRPAERSSRIPPALRAFAQRDTDIGLMPRCRATSACFQPLCKSAAADLRRCSNAHSASRSRLTPRGFPMQET
jgi:hypothetical protein